MPGLCPEGKLVETGQCSAGKGVSRRTLDVSGPWWSSLLPNLLFYVVSWMYYEQPVFFYSENVMICLHKVSYFSCIRDIISAQLVWSTIIILHAEMLEVTLSLCVRELSAVMHWMCCLFGYFWPELHWATQHFKMPKEKGKVSFLHFCTFLTEVPPAFLWKV